MKTSTPPAPRTDSQNNTSRGDQPRSRQPLRPQQVDQSAPSAGSRSSDDSKVSPPRARTEQSPRNQEQLKQTQSSEAIREEVAHEEIARRAHELWEQDGRQDGRDQEHWLEAEKQLRGSSFRGDADFERGDAHAQARAIKEAAERRENGPSRN